MHVSFAPGNITSGSTTDLIVTYASAAPVTLYLNGWDPDEFTVTPTSFELPADAAGRTTPPPPLRVRITRKRTNTSCFVHVALGTQDDDFASVEVI